METACVTGATGFLGSELVAQLLQGGYKVHASVRSLANTERNGCLLSLPGAHSARLTLFEADLLDEGAFDGCVAGARYVFHTASPFVTSNISDPELQLIAPALNGTRNVFGSIGRSIAMGAAPPRVVLTSSVAAVMGTPADKASCFDESDWNLSSQAGGNPPGHGLDMYRYSKVVAEREAWRLAGLQELEMASILPSFIVGPPRTPRADSESLLNMRQALEGEMPPRGDTAMVDVRDVATAHVAAARIQGAVGHRFVLSSPTAVPRARLLQLLKGKYPTFELADAGTPADPATLRELFCSKTTVPLLGLTLRDPDQSLLAMAEAMIALGSATPSKHTSPAKRAPKLASARKVAMQLWQRLVRKYKQMVLSSERTVQDEL